VVQSGPAPPRGPIAMVARRLDAALGPHLLDRLADIRDLLENPAPRERPAVYRVRLPGPIQVRPG